MINYFNLISVLLLALLGTDIALANQSVVPISIRGTVVAPSPCSINNNIPIEVNFGDIYIELIDGINYKKKEVPFVLSCIDDLDAKSVIVNFGGTSSTIDNRYYSTSKPDLAIKMVLSSRGSERLLLPNGYYPLNLFYPNTPTIYATPVKNSNKNPFPGSFVSTATVYVDYL